MKIVKLETQRCTKCPSVSAFLQDNGVEFETVDLGKSPEAGMKYGAMSVPVTILFDDEGNEVDRVNGNDTAQLEQLIQKLQ